MQKSHIKIKKLKTYNNI